MVVAIGPTTTILGPRLMAVLSKAGGRTRSSAQGARFKVVDPVSIRVVLLDLLRHRATGIQAREEVVSISRVAFSLGGAASRATMVSLGDKAGSGPTLVFLDHPLAAVLGANIRLALGLALLVHQGSFQGSSPSLFLFLYLQCSIRLFQCLRNSRVTLRLRRIHILGVVPLLGMRNLFRLHPLVRFPMPSTFLFPTKLPRRNPQSRPTVCPVLPLAALHTLRTLRLQRRKLRHSSILHNGTRMLLGERLCLAVARPRVISLISRQHNRNLRFNLLCLPLLPLPRLPSWAFLRSLIRIFLPPHLPIRHISRPSGSHSRSCLSHCLNNSINSLRSLWHPLSNFPRRLRLLSLLRLLQRLPKFRRFRPNRLSHSRHPPQSLHPRAILSLPGLRNRRPPVRSCLYRQPQRQMCKLYMVRLCPLLPPLPRPDRLYPCSLSLFGACCVDALVCSRPVGLV